MGVLNSFQRILFFSFFLCVFRVTYKSLGFKVHFFLLGIVSRDLIVPISSTPLVATCYMHSASIIIIITDREETTNRIETKRGETLFDSFFFVKDF